jgi:hypothetical protein
VVKRVERPSAHHDPIEVSKTASMQRAMAVGAHVGHEEFVLYPGDLTSYRLNVDMKMICDTAFVAYETLYSLATSPLSVSSLAWGSSLDISTARLHYGE